MTDKFKHFISCFIINFIIGFFNLNIAIAFTAGVGIGKEAGDLLRDKTKWKDSILNIVADSLGIIIGYILLKTIKYGW